MTDATYADIDLSDAVPEAIIKRVVRQLLGERRTFFETVPGRAGSWAFNEEPGDRLITLELAVVGDASTYPTTETALEARRRALRALAAWSDSTRPQELIIDDEPDRYFLAMLERSPSPAEWLTKGEVDLGFRASPYAYALELSTAALTLAAAIPDTFDIEDEVNAYPVIEITASDAMPSGFTLTVNGLELVYGTAVGIGDTITVSALSFTVALGANTDTELASTFIPGDLSMADVDGDFPILVPGTNTVIVGGGDSTVAVTWRRRFR